MFSFVTTIAIAIDVGGCKSSRELVLRNGYEITVADAVGGVDVVGERVGAGVAGEAVDADFGGRAGAGDEPGEAGAGDGVGLG